MRYMRQVSSLVLSGLFFSGAALASLPVPVFVDQTESKQVVGAGERELVSVYSRMSGAGLPVGQFQEGVRLWESGTDKRAGLALITRAANAGYSEASLYIAELLWVGGAVQRDTAGSLNWYKMAAGQGSHAAALKLVRTNGLSSGELDDSDYLRFAASGDSDASIEAAALLGYKIMSGLESGGRESSLFFLRKASEAGDVVAFYNLGVLLLSGNTSISKAEATEIEMSLLSSAEGKHAPAAYLLGNLYSGLSPSFPENHAAAAQYFLQAANGGVVEATARYHEAQLQAKRQAQLVAPPKVEAPREQASEQASVAGFKAPIDASLESLVERAINIASTKPEPKPEPKPVAKPKPKPKAIVAAKPKPKAKPLEPANVIDIEGGDYVLVRRVANIRTAPDTTTGIVIDQLTEGSQLLVMGKEDLWLRVRPLADQRFADGSRDAWIYSTLVAKRS